MNNLLPLKTLEFHSNSITAFTYKGSCRKIMENPNLISNLFFIRIALQRFIPIFSWPTNKQKNEDYDYDSDGCNCNCMQLLLLCPAEPGLAYRPSPSNPSAGLDWIPPFFQLVLRLLLLLLRRPWAAAIFPVFILCPHRTQEDSEQFSPFFFPFLPTSSDGLT